jgi:hypothetical protein
LGFSTGSAPGRYRPRTPWRGQVRALTWNHVTSNNWSPPTCSLLTCDLMSQALRIPPGIRSSFTAWPPSPCGRLSRPPWRGVTPATTTGPVSPWDSRPVGDPAFVPVIRASATQAPRSSPWMPSLGIAPALEVRRTQRHAGAVPGPGFMRLSGGGKVYPGWRLGFRQSSFSHIARVPSARRPYASARPLVSWHALVPFTFQIQVSHQTQKYPPNPSRLHRGYNRAPRGAGWSLVWSWFLPDLSVNGGSTVATRFTDDTMTRVGIATASDRAGCRGLSVARG